MIRTPAALALPLMLWLALCPALLHADESAPTLTPRVLVALPHDRQAFTQGLFLHRGLLYESVGRYGQSALRITDPDTGRELRRRDLPADRFGEGAARLGGSVLQLTWKSGTGLILDLETLELQATFRFEGEGWGLASTPEGPVMSNGSAELVFLAPDTLRPARRITVALAGEPLPRLNELEWIDGRIWCNIWLEDRIAVVDPADGRVTALVNLAPLRGRLGKGAGVANGIAHDPETGRLLLTGKNWEHVFDVVVEAQ